MRRSKKNLILRYLFFPLVLSTSNSLLLLQQRSLPYARNPPKKRKDLTRSVNSKAREREREEFNEPRTLVLRQCPPLLVSSFPRSSRLRSSTPKSAWRSTSLEVRTDGGVRRALPFFLCVIVDNPPRGRIAEPDRMDVSLVRLCELYHRVRPGG